MVVGMKKGKLGTYAMKRVAAGAHLPIPGAGKNKKDQIHSDKFGAWKSTIHPTF